MRFGEVSAADPMVDAKGTQIVLAGIIVEQLGNFLSTRTS